MPLPLLRDRPPAIRYLAVGVAVAVVVLAAVGVWVATRPAVPALAADGPVQPANRPVPASIAHLPLVDQDGRPTDLADFHGRTVVFVDFMTSCQEECPITTGALLSVEKGLAQAHLLHQVVVVEATVDVWRDSPSRLRAYQRDFGVHWPLLTGSVTTIRRLWDYFGVYYERVAESNPPDINWENGKPYTFDITHTDAAFVLAPDGTERAFAGGYADVDGHLPKDLRTLLDAQGRQDLSDPGDGSWTPAQMLDAVGSVIGRSIPAPSGS